MASWFSRFAKWTSSKLGHPLAFFIAVLIIVVWALAGPIFHFSDTWQLVINTGTTIVTFLMVFLIQNTQNRDSEALHLKLDELIRATKNTQNRKIPALFAKEDIAHGDAAQSRDIWNPRRRRKTRARRTVLQTPWLI